MYPFSFTNNFTQFYMVSIHELVIMKINNFADSLSHNDKCK